MAFGRDLSARRTAERRQRLLVHELQHRVKNTLANVRSMAEITARNHPVMDDFMTVFGGRLQAMARTHSLLADEVGQRIDIADLVEGELVAFRNGGGSGVGARVQVEGPSLRLPPRCAVALAMGLHELATNAARHGALSVPEGRVEVRWTTEMHGGTTTVDLHWSEMNGPLVSGGPRRGFGRLLLERGLASDLGGSTRLSFEPAGLNYHVRFPVPPESEDQPRFVADLPV